MMIPLSELQLDIARVRTELHSFAELLDNYDEVPAAPAARIKRKMAETLHFLALVRHKLGYATKQRPKPVNLSAVFAQHQTEHPCSPAH
jgi:hypothetical protein